MFEKQISVFIENREGRLGDVLGVLQEAKINILSASLADTSDYGILRLVVDDPEKGSEALAKKGFSAKVSDVILARIPNEVGALEQLVRTLSDAKVNIEYMYGLSANDGKASVVLKTNNCELASEIIALKYEQ